MADGILTPCNVARSWHWFRQVAAPAMWHVALGWHAIEFAQTSPILEFYIWYRFRPHHRSRHVILHQSAKFYPNQTTLGRKIWRPVDFQDGGSKPSWILGGPIMVSLKSLCTTSYWSSIDIKAVNCLVFEKIAFFAFWRQRQTEKLTNKQMDSPNALSRCRERRFNKLSNNKF